MNKTQLKIVAVISKLGQRGDQRREDADEGRSPDRNRNLSESLSHQSVHPIMSWKDWFKEPQYYQVIGGKNADPNLKLRSKCRNTVYKNRFSGPYFRSLPGWSLIMQR